MHILYVDESGSPREEGHFVVAGLAVPENEIYRLSRRLDNLQSTHFPDVEESVEFHVRILREQDPGKMEAPFKDLAVDKKNEIIRSVYRIIGESNSTIFGMAVEKPRLQSIEPYEKGLVDIVGRFDIMLARIKESDTPERGIVAVASSCHADSLRSRIKVVLQEGHQFGKLRQLADVPFFVPAKSTRLLQLADFVANAIYGYYQDNRRENFDIISPRIDYADGHLHGLYHYKLDWKECSCIACKSRLR